MGKQESHDANLDKFLEDFTEIGMENELKEKWGSKIRAEHSHKRKHSLFKILAIAASLLILVLAFIFFNKADNNLRNIGTDNIAMVKSEVLQDINFRDNTSTPAEWVLFRKAVKENRYQDAINMYNNVGSKGNILDQLLLAIAYSNLNNASDGAFILNSIIQANTLYAPEAKWILANLYIKEHELEKASSILSQIASSQEYKSMEASNLLITIKKNHE